MVSIGTGPRAWVRAAYTLIEAAEAAAPATSCPPKPGSPPNSASPRPPPAACRELTGCDVAASIYRWERGTVNPGDRYRLYYCHVLGIPSDRFGDPAQDTSRVIITISLPEGTDARIRLASTESPADPGHGHPSPHPAQHHA